MIFLPSLVILDIELVVSLSTCMVDAMVGKAVVLCRVRYLARRYGFRRNVEGQSPRVFEIVETKGFWETRT